MAYFIYEMTFLWNLQVFGRNNLIDFPWSTSLASNSNEITHIYLFITLAKLQRQCLNVSMYVLIYDVSVWGFLLEWSSLRIFKFRNWHLMRGGLVLPDSIPEEKLKIDWKMEDLQARTFWRMLFWDLEQPAPELSSV